jgi:hypothetical protein
LKNIIILNTSVISQKEIKAVSNANLLLLPSMYFEKSTDNISFLNKYKFKDNIFFSYIPIDKRSKYTYLIEKGSFVALYLDNIKIKYNKVYILRNIGLESILENEEIFYINSTFKIWKIGKEYRELPSNFINDSESYDDIDFKIQNNKKILGYISIKLLNLKKIKLFKLKNLNTILTLSMFLASTYILEDYVLKLKTINNYNEKIKKLKIKDSNIYIKNELKILKKLESKYNLYISDLKQIPIINAFDEIDIDFKKRKISYIKNKKRNIKDFK